MKLRACACVIFVIIFAYQIQESSQWEELWNTMDYYLLRVGNTLDHIMMTLSYSLQTAAVTVISSCDNAYTRTEAHGDYLWATIRDSVKRRVRIWRNNAKKWWRRLIGCECESNNN